MILNQSAHVFSLGYFLAINHYLMQPSVSVLLHTLYNYITTFQNGPGCLQSTSNE